MSSVSHTNLL